MTISARGTGTAEVAAAVDLAVAIGALPVALGGELVGRMQRVAVLLGGLMRG